MALRTALWSQAVSLLFLGIPDRWYDGNRWRCAKGHISRFILKSEVKGALCLECYEPVLLTFPEDEEGSALGAEVYALRMHHFEQTRPRKLTPPEAASVPGRLDERPAEDGR
jgi:hypothetical protein